MINKLIFILIALLFLSFGYSQTNEIKIRFIGNCGLYITDGTSNIYTDFPYKSGAHHYMEYANSELDSIRKNSYFIFTHKHSDHYYKGKVNKILKAKNGKKYGKWNISELENLGKIIPEFEIQTFKTKHLFSFKHYSYLITWHGKRIFLSGDTESAETIIGIKDIDWAFIPSWLVSKIEATGELLSAQNIGIYHIAPRDKINFTSEKVLMLDKQGEIISISY